MGVEARATGRGGGGGWGGGRTLPNSRWLSRQKFSLLCEGLHSSLPEATSLAYLVRVRVRVGVRVRVRVGVGVGVRVGVGVHVPRAHRDDVDLQREGEG